MKTQYRKVRKYISLVESTMYRNVRPLENVTYVHCGYKESNTPPPLTDFAPYTLGEPWGTGPDSQAWFHFTLHIPEEMRSAPVQLLFHSDFDGKFGVGSTPQFLLYINGEIRQGMDTRHIECVLDEGCTDADVYVYAYTGPRTPSVKCFGSIRNVNTDAKDLYYDLAAPVQMLDFMDENSREYAEILRYLHTAVSMLDLYDLDSEEYMASVRAAHTYMTDEFYGKYCSPQPVDVSCIGHTHIDCAWLWTLRQSREKAQRSFATVLKLMEEYPDYKFMSSQPLLYQFVKEEAPELYEKIKERVAEGRWECEGGMWVEADCNLSSGESLVRQLMYGKRFFREEFGKDNHILWLPDVFGYSAALPQILRKSGVDWFVTSKIGWNDVNQMPYDTFRWRGLDGTEINTYFLTAQDQERGKAPIRQSTYNGYIDAKMLAGTWNRYQQKNLNNNVLLTYGYGDGGGGPTRYHLEMAKRLSKGVPGLPNARLTTASEALTEVEKNIRANPHLLPTWYGELYLEYHRGTYTSIAKNKKNNRKSEFLYQNAEKMAVLGKLLRGSTFPKADLRRGWEMLLTNQFHDIIPGSSIGPVYDQSDLDYAWLMKLAADIEAQEKNAIAGQIAADKGVVVFNANGFTADGYVNVDGQTAYVTGIAPNGYTTVSEMQTDNAIRIDGHTVETALLKAVFDEKWQMISLYDKTNEREVLTSGGAGNQLRVYADYPDRYDAWEWQEYSLDKYRVVDAVASVEIVEDGARRGIRVVRPFMKSTITQTMWFYDHTAKIDFDTTIDMHQHQQMIKAAFDVDVQSDKATYDVQFGTVERPTHKNTSWDRAKFEVCAHKYADLSDGGFGVSLMNDCKYGYDIHDGTMMLSLLKSGTMPYPDADQGEHSFVYSLYVHSGTVREGGTAEQAYLLNNPLTAVKASGAVSSLPECYALVSVDRANVMCETIKEAEDSGDVIVRLYENKNIRTKAELTPGFPVKQCWLCDLMENELEELPVENGKISLKLGGYEIVTLKFRV